MMQTTSEDDSVGVSVFNMLFEVRFPRLWMTFEGGFEQPRPSPVGERYAVLDEGPTQPPDEAVVFTDWGSPYGERPTTQIMTPSIRASGVEQGPRALTGMQNGPMPIRRPLVLTGAPAIGKSATGLAVALGRTHRAFVDVDDVRQLVVVGGAAPWQGLEGVRQQLLGVRNACALAREFAAAGIETVLADVLTTATLSVYREDLHGCVVVRMTAPLSETLKRASTRPAWLTESEFHSLYEADATNPLSADHTLDVAPYDLGHQVAEVERLWSRLSCETT